ncbi:MAG: methyltransferase domain-containing protein [Pseudomonadota bacterium]|nr:methyltransferase domain-containing protein [Pseudomonadota bacterium]
MNRAVAKIVVCPRCLPDEYSLTAVIDEEEKDDILSGELCCRHCGHAYAIREGIAFLNPRPRTPAAHLPRYETDLLLASYIWSHYADLMADPEASTAYREWSALLNNDGGWGLDIGAAVGRFTFEMSRQCDFVIGIDTSVSFIRAARWLLRQRTLSVALPEEGNLQRQVTLQLPTDWSAAAIEFIVADAQALPFKAGIFSQLSSLNLVDKLPQPLAHLTEINRVARRERAQLLFSDPFSWSLEVANEKDWLGGTEAGTYTGFGQDNIKKLLSNPAGPLQPAWKVAEEGSVWWKIRSHRNHYELIRSCFLQAER